MKYPCNLIQDLLPLYHDGVCSRESIEIIENHLSECTACKEYYASLCEADEIVVKPQNEEQEMKKAASFQAVRKKLHRKQILMIAGFTVLLAVIVFTVVAVLKNSDQVISKDAVSVSLTEDGLIGKLKGSEADYFKVKRVETAADGQTKTYLFFSMSGTKWSELTTSDAVFSEYVLCPADKGAGQVDRVYYYTGDDTGIETMDEAALQEVINTSSLLWSKEK